MGQMGFGKPRKTGQNKGNKPRKTGQNEGDKPKKNGADILKYSVIVDRIWHGGKNNG